MARVYRRKGVWYLDITVGGVRIRKRVGASKKLAELALKDAEGKAVRDELGLNRPKITIDSLIEKFLDYSRTNHRVNTTKRYKAVTDHLRQFLAATHPHTRLVTQLSTQILEQYKTFRRSEWTNPNGSHVASAKEVQVYTRKGARTRTVNLEIEGIRIMLNMAVRWGYINSSPARDVKLLKDEDAKPFRFLTQEECQRFLAGSPPDLRPIYFTFLHTGMRKSELENLEWSDVDLERKKIRIQRKEHWQPKAGERDIPMSDAVVRLFTELRRKGKKKIPETLVFNIQDSGHSHNRLRRELIKIAASAGIKNFTKIHTLRHTFASHLIMRGVDLPTVRALMGHTDIKTTMIYAHLAPDHLANAVNKLPFE